MPRSRGRLSGLSFFILTALAVAFILAGGLSSHAVEGCAHNYIEVGKFSATCSSRGGISYQCTECGNAYIDYTEQELPHTWKTVKETRPTCTASGSRERICTVCGTTDTETTAQAAGHLFGENIVQKPTCTKEGYTYRICGVCNFVEIDETSYTPKSEHTYGEQHVSTQPTCQQTGIAESTCSVCGYVYREQLDKVGHDLAAAVTPPTHSDTGYTTYSCQTCEYIELKDFTEKIPYDMEYTITEPTCTESGVKVGVCRDGCLHTETEVLPAAGHLFSEDGSEGWTVVREASEALEGLERRVCQSCGLTESRSIAYIMPEPEPEPIRKTSPLLLIGIGFALILLVGVTVVLLLILLEHSGHKHTRKYALLAAVDKALAEQKQDP